MKFDGIFDSDARLYDREDVYVELAIIRGNEMDRILRQECDREFHYQQYYFQHANIGRDDILKSENNFVLVRGIAGIGKSTMINTYTYEWAKKDELMTSLAKIHFLFKFTCRDLNSLEDETFGSLKTLFEKNFPEVFEYVSLDELNEISSSVLVLVDGIDELKDISRINEEVTKNKALPNPLRCLKNLLNPNHIDFNHKTIVIGRPESCQRIRNCYRPDPNIAIRMVEICGFSDESKKSFINKNVTRAGINKKDIIDKIMNTYNLHMMASIPIYLWVICQIINENVDIAPIKTTTQLCTYAMLLFVQKHLNNEDEQNKKMDLDNLCIDNDICDQILLLAELSKRTYEQNKVVFTMEDLGRNIILKTEKTGFIVHNNRTYQFRHLVLQEYLAGLYIFLTGNIGELENESNLKSCLPTVTGLTDPQTNRLPFISEFVQHLHKRFAKQKNIFMKLWKLLKSLFISKKTADIQEVLEGYLRTLIKEDVFTINDQCGTLLTAANEFSYNFSESFKSEIATKKVKVVDLIFQHDITYAIDLMRSLEIDAVEQISISNFGNNRLPTKVIELFKLYFGVISDRTNRVCELRTGREMSIKPREPQYPTERYLYVTLIPRANQKEGQEKEHDELILSLVQLVGQVVIDYSFDSYEKFIDLRKQLPTNERPILKYKDVAEFNLILEPTPLQEMIFRDSNAET